MRRRFLTFAAAASTVLFVAMASLWVRSFYRFDSVAYGSGFNGGFRQTSHAVTSDGGVICCVQSYYELNQPPPPGFTWTEAGFSASSRPATGRDDLAHVQQLGIAQGSYRVGFGCLVFDQSMSLGRLKWTIGTRVFAVPHWAPVVLFALMPTCRIACSVRRRIRTMRGQCACCGYDLRGTPHCCPECGGIPHEPPHNPPMQRTATAGSGAVE